MAEAPQSRGWTAGCHMSEKGATASSSRMEEPGGARHAWRSPLVRFRVRPPNARAAVSRLALVLPVVSLALVLTSCGLFVKMLGIPTDCAQYREEVDFDTSDRIVRGAWTGTVEDYPTEGSESDLTLDLTASYVDRQEYAVSGTFSLEGEPPATVDGTVRGGCAERYVSSGVSAQHQSGTSDLSPQSLPPGIFLDTEVRGSGGELLWTASYSESSAFVSRGDTLLLRLDSAEANPLHPVSRSVDVVRTSP